MLDAQRFDWIKKKGGEWEPARYMPSDGDYPQHFVTTEGKRLPMQEVLLIGQPLIPPDAREVTVRDKFAMAALNGIIQWAYGDVPKNSDADLISADAYRLADAMMKAREGK